MHMGHVHIHANNRVKYVKHYIAVVVGPISTTLLHICLYTHVCFQYVCKYTCLVGTCRGQRLISSIFYHCLLIFLRQGLLLILGLVILPGLLVSKSPGTAWSTAPELVMDESCHTLFLTWMLRMQTQVLVAFAHSATFPGPNAFRVTKLF